MRKRQYLALVAGAAAMAAGTAANAAIIGQLGFENTTAGQNTNVATGGELGFSTAFTTINAAAGAPVFGANDHPGQVAATALTGNDAGSSASLIAANSNKTGNQYYVTANHITANGGTRQTALTVGPVTITGFTNRQVSLRVFHANTSYETGAQAQGIQDLLQGRLDFSDATNQTLYDTVVGPSSGDIDSQTIGLVRENYATLTFNIPDSVTANTVNLVLTSTGNSSQAAESFAYDNIQFTGDAVPEPASLGLVGVAGLGLLGRRRRKA